MKRMDSDSDSDILEDIKALEDALARENDNPMEIITASPSNTSATSNILTPPDSTWDENHCESSPSKGIRVKRNINNFVYAGTDSNVGASNGANYHVGGVGLSNGANFPGGTKFASDAGTSVLPHPVEVENDFDFADHLQTRIQEKLKTAKPEVQEQEGEGEESLLELNLKLAEILQTTKSELQVLLKECKERRRQLLESRRGTFAEDSSVAATGCPRNSCCTAGMPYFKDRTFFSQPKNRDVILKEANSEIQVVALPRVSMWTKKDRGVLLKAIRRDAVDDWIARCSREADQPVRGVEEEDEDEDQDQERRRRSKREKDPEWGVGVPGEVDKDGFLPRNLQTLVGKLGEREFDWMKIALKDFDWKHTPEECRVMWNVFLHPDINKSRWQKSEDALLTQLAKRYKCENWDAIAADLRTNRSGYQCFIRYNTKNAGRSIHVPWRASECKRLEFLVETFRTGDYIPWGQIAGCMDNRTKQQIYFRWNFTLAPHLKKGRFTKEEDEMLLRAVEKHGRNFGRISSVLMPQRTCAQLSEHYDTLMARQRGWSARLWSLEDDIKLISLYRRFGSNWSRISASFRERNRTQVRHRYTSLMRYEHKGVPLEQIPNRSEQSPGDHLQPLPRHQDRPQLQPTNRSKSIRSDPLEQIRPKLPSKMLLHHFYGIPTRRVGRKRKLFSPQELEHTCERILELLKLLRVDRLDLRNFERFQLSERNRQVLFRFQDWDFEFPRTRSQVTAEQVEAYRRRMFGDQEEEEDGERQHYIPPLPFGAYLRKKPHVTKKEVGIECRPVSDRFLIPYERSIPSCSVSEAIDEEFERLGRLLTAPTRTSNIIHVKGSSSTRIERVYILTSKELQEQILEEGRLSRLHDSEGISRDQEQERQEQQEVEEVRVPQLLDVEALKPSFATLNCYQNLLSAQELLELKKGRPVEPLDLRTISEPGMIRATNLLFERLLQLFRIPIGMSKVPPPEMHGADGFYLFDLENIVEEPMERRVKRKDSGQEDEGNVKKKPKVFQEEELDIKHVISQETEELRVSQLK